MSKLCLGCMKPMKDQDMICPACGYVVGTPAKEAYHIPPGSSLNKRYLIGRVLGFGGFGITYIGYDQVLNIPVAIKEYLPGEFATRAPGQSAVTIYSGEWGEQFILGKDKFIDEARRLIRFQKVPGIVSIYDSFEENNTAYLIMEYLDGESLKEKLEREKKLSVEEALGITKKVLTALAAVHKDEIIHRDVAPDNIYLTKAGEVKLLDFGAARFAMSKHTRSLTIMVKSGYTPQEQYQSHGKQGPWTDVYAVAATCYHMLTGVVPQNSMDRGKKDHLKPPSRMGVKLPKSVDRALMNALNLKVEDRTQSAEAFMEELEAARVTVKKSTRKKQKAIKWPLWLKIGVAAGMAGVLVFLGLLAANVIHFDISVWSQTSVAEGMVRIPNLINRTQEEAFHEGERLGIQVKANDKEYSDEVPEGRVLRQSLEAGQVVSKEKVISITISAGIEQTYVPDFVGYSRERAEEILLEAGLKGVFEETEGVMAPGAVESQSLKPETILDTGSEIVLKLSKGKETDIKEESVQIPELKGEVFEDLADTLFSEYGLYLKKEEAEASDTKSAGSVLSQSPAGGERTEVLTVISVTVSAGPQKNILPDVEYKTAEEARRLLKASGFEVAEELEYSDTVEEGSVISQSEEGNRLMPIGSEIVLVISQGAEPVQQTEPESQPDNRQTGRNQNTNRTRQATQAPTQAPVETQAPAPTEAAAPPETAAPQPETTAPQPETQDQAEQFFNDIVNFQDSFE